MSKKYLTDKELEDILARSDDSDQEYEPLSSDDELSDAENLQNQHESVADIQSYILDTSQQNLNMMEIDSSSSSEHEEPPPQGRFDWSTDEFSPDVHEFDESSSGCKIQGTSALNFFEYFFTSDIMKLTADEINRYYNFLCRNDVPEFSRMTRWKPVDFKELYCFLATALLMPHTKKQQISNYWSTDPYISTPIFQRLMKRDRFLLILKLLHFTDNDYVPVEKDSLIKIRVIVDHLRERFKEGFVPSQNICIDQSLMLFRGRVFFRQYIPSKRHRFGVKFFLLCDCDTGYILDFLIYTGATTDIKDFTDRYDIGKTGSIVLTLLEPYVEKGHMLYVDNWYTSPNLFDTLHKMKTNACGTVKSTRKNMPKITTKLSSGEFTYRSCKKLLAVRYKDKREVNMLSSSHTPDVKSVGTDRATGRQIFKPTCIVDYNTYMGAVDQSDMLLSSVKCVRKSKKWYKKVYFHLLDMAVLNSYQMYKTTTPNYVSIETFHLRLVKELIDKYHIPLTRTGGGRPRLEDAGDLRLTERHFPSYVPPTERKQKPTKRCVVCAKHSKRAESRYMCSVCGVALCVVPCFKKYHTMKIF